MGKIMNNGNAVNHKTFIATLEKHMEKRKTINYLRAAADIPSLCAGNGGQDDDED